MKFPLTEFGVKVNAERGKRGMTWRDLSAAINCDYGFMHEVLHGKGTSAPLESKISTYFGWN